MTKKSKPIGEAPELPPEVTGPIDPEEVLELNDEIDGPIDDKLADLLIDADSDKEVKTAPEIKEEAELESSEVKSDINEKPVDEAPKDAEEINSAEVENGPEINLEKEDPVLDKAIEDIVAEESDAVLAAEDMIREEEEDKVEEPKKQERFRDFLSKFWRNPKARWAALIVLILTSLTLALVPHSRYFLLNTAGVRASLSLTVIDGGTLQPLKNVNVSAGGVSAVTNGDGIARLERVKLGRTTLRIEKRAFSPHYRNITVGWGSNPLGEFRATAVGSQYTFLVRDAFSGNPMPHAEASSGEGDARADESGKLVLTLDTAEMEDSEHISVQIYAEGYRTEIVDMVVSNKETQDVMLVPSRKHVFVSKRSGKYDVYSIDLDGKNEQRLVEGTGLERDDIALVPHLTQNKAALVATRENNRNPNGYLLSTLYILNTESGDLMKVDQSEQIKIIGWTNEGRLIYVKIAAGASGTDPSRHRLMSFNGNEDSNKELARSNTFNDVILASDRVYYAPSNIFQETKPAIYSIKPDGSDKQIVLNKEVYKIVRADYDTLYLSAGDDWHKYVLGSPQTAVTEAPSSTDSRVYQNNPTSKFSIWIDQRDGKGVLINYDKTSSEEKTLYERGGLRLPAYWLNDKYIVYRVSDGKETADYALNIEGGEPKKITDVTDTSGITRWFYY